MVNTDDPMMQQMEQAYPGLGVAEFVLARWQVRAPPIKLSLTTPPIKLSTDAATIIAPAGAAAVQSVRWVHGGDPVEQGARQGAGAR